MDSYGVNWLDKSKKVDIIGFMTAHLSLINNTEQTGLVASPWLSKLPIMKNKSHLFNALLGDNIPHWKENAVVCLCQLIANAETCVQQVLINL